jgi:hypothetical protein
MMIFRKRRIWFVLVFFCCFLKGAFSQLTYIVKDSTTSFGVEFIHGFPKENAQFIQVKTSDGVVKYTPYEIKEYRLKDGTVYYSRDISIKSEVSDIEKRVFLERIESGKINLYYYASKELNTYFIEIDNVKLMELPKPKGEFRAIILENTDDNTWVNERVRFSQYGRASLANLISLYNSGDRRFFPHKRFGVNAGISNTLLKVPRGIPNLDIRLLEFERKLVPTIGFFVDIPIVSSNVSLNAGINFSKNGYSSSFKNEDLVIDYLVDLTSIEIPVLLRYSFSSPVLRPFASLGGSMIYNVSNANVLYKSDIDGNTVSLSDVVTDNFVSDMMYGVILGVGVQYSIDFKRDISIEMRYGNTVGTKHALTKNQFNFLIGFTF